MRLPLERPISLAISFALIRAANKIVPPAKRRQFEYDWQQKLVHRWQFLRQTGLWNRIEELKLLIAALPSVTDALQHFGSQEWVRRRVSRFLQSPFTCLAGLLAILVSVAIFSRGFPATQDLFLKRVDSGSSKLVFVWSHNLRGGGDRPLPSDVVDAWKKHSHLISSVAPFRALHRDVQIGNASSEKRLVIITTPSFFEVTGGHASTKPVTAALKAYVLLSYNAWIEQFHASPGVGGSNVTIGKTAYPVLGILPPGFEPLSRQAAIYLVQPRYLEPDAYAVVTANAGVSGNALDKEFSEIAQDFSYYFLNGRLRFGFAQAAIGTPARVFAFAVIASGLVLLVVFRMNRRMLWPQANHRRAFLRRTGFFLAKASLGLAFVFTVCLEWSRSDSAVLFGNFDPATGPFLLWLYILGAMGVLFAVVIDQKARCRECLQLLVFPVRMGSPGTVLLDWSGMELCCAQGHGVLHVPHLAPSWAEESEHWIALDDSWQGVFGRDRRD